MTVDCPHCAALRRQVRELAEELEAWRELGGEDATSDQSLTLWRIKQRLYPDGSKAPARGAVAKALLQMMSAPGRLQTKDRLLDAIALSDPDRQSGKLTDVVICHLRKALRDLGLPSVITTIWGQGYLIEPAAADQIKAVLGPEVFA